MIHSDPIRGHLAKKAAELAAAGGFLTEAHALAIVRRIALKQSGERLPAPVLRAMAAELIGLVDEVRYGRQKR